MTDHPQQTKPNEHRYYPEDEIELMDYLLVIWKWKYLILAGTFAFALAAAIISFISWKQHPKKYRTEIILQPEGSEINLIIDDDKPKVYLDSRKKIKALKENDLKHEILNYIKSSNSKNLLTSPEFQVYIPIGSNKINVSLESASVDDGVNILNYLVKVLLAEYPTNIKKIQKAYEEKIESIKINYATLKAQEARAKREFKNKLKLMKIQLEDLTDKEKRLYNKIIIIKKRLNETIANNRSLKNNIERLNRKRESFTKKNNQNNLVTSLVYNNTVQQYLSLENSNIQEINRLLIEIEEEEYNRSEIQREIDAVSAEINELKERKTDNKSLHIFQPGLINISKQKERLSKEVRELEKEKLSIQNIQVVQPPDTIELPKINKIKRNVVLSSVMGLFLMIFIAFFLDYLNSYKKRGSNK